MGTEQEEREDYVSQLLDTSNNPWLGVGFLRHVRRVFARLPLSVLQELVQKEVGFFAPDHSYWGMVRQLDPTALEGKLIVYLSPELLSYPRDKIEPVIAHELAHVVLGHKEEPKTKPMEDEDAANDLAKSWGFARPAGFGR